MGKQNVEKMNRIDKIPAHMLDMVLDKPVEFITDVVPIKVEKLTDKKYRFETVGSIANVINSNNRVIPFVVQRDAVADWSSQKWQLTAYIGHPEGDIRGNPEELAGIPDILKLTETGETVVNIRVLETEKGIKVKQLFDEGVELGVSQRAIGIQSVREDADGQYYIVVDKIVKLLGYDFCFLDSAAAGERTRLKLVDAVELDKLVNRTRITDIKHSQEEVLMDPKELEKLAAQNGELIKSVTTLVDVIQAQVKANSTALPADILDSFTALKTGVEKMQADTTLDAEKKNAHLTKLATDLKAIVDTIVPPTLPEQPAQTETAQASPTPVVDVSAIDDSTARLKAFIDGEQKIRDARALTEKLGKYLLDKVGVLTQGEDVRKSILDSLKARTFANEAGIDAAIEDATKLFNLGVAQEKMNTEGIRGKGTGSMEIKVTAEHLKGVEALTDMVLETGIVAAKKEDIVSGKNRQPSVQKFLKIYDSLHEANLVAEGAKIVAMLDATTTPADFDVPYTISRIVLEEVYSDQIINQLVDFGPMENKRDQVPITRYRREAGNAGTKKTYKPSKARQSEIKVGELKAIPKGKLTTEWFDIDATASKLQASFSDEFATLSKRTPNITGISRGIANLIGDMRRSLQQMVMADMRNTALAFGSVAFTYNGVGNGATSQFTVCSGASISSGEPITVTVDGVSINEYEVSVTGTTFYVLSGPEGKILFVDADGAPQNIADTKAIVVSGKKATNEVRFSLTAATGYKWGEWMNKLLFSISNQAAYHRETRGYKPEFVLASEVTANYMTQADAYASSQARSGFSASSVVGEGNYGRTANLPTFGSDVFDDQYILLSQKDATIFRIYEPMSLKGPYPVRGADGALLGGDEYYIYQEDALESPIGDKMSLVTVLP